MPTKYEKTRMIASRALQIAMGAPILINLSEEELKKLRYNPISIAELEVKKGVNVLNVKPLKN
ncbi:MAG: DNA-directed RNA polymerase subunit omega [Candidatus Woesearchaeota archaeon]